jgi:uncharacterized protein (TIGR03000 family)
MFGGLTCLALLLAVDNAQAQLRGRRANMGGYGQGPGYIMQGDGSIMQGQGYAVQGQGYVVQGQMPQQGTIIAGRYMGPSDAYTSLSSGQQSQQQLQDSGQVLIRVLAAPGVRISIEGQAMQQQPGMERLFLSPALDRSSSYVYTVRASWDQNGQVVTRERRVPCSAGQQITVSFLDGDSQNQQQIGSQQQQRDSQQQQQQQSQPTSRQQQQRDQ